MPRFESGLPDALPLGRWGLRILGGLVAAVAGALLWKLVPGWFDTGLLDHALVFVPVVGSVLAQQVEAIPLVQNATDRATKFAAPPLNQRVFRLDSLTVERWNGSVWIVDFPAPSWTKTLSTAAYPRGTSGNVANDNAVAVNAAIAAAPGLGATLVQVVASHLPYTAGSVAFNTGLRMTREGGDSSVYDVRAYGAAGDGVTDDSAAFQAALAGAAAQVEYFGTALGGTPSVVLPTVASASGSTNSYLITSTLAIPQGVRLRGLGSYAPVVQFNPSGASSTLFTFFGSSESQAANVLLENLFCYQANTAGTSIGMRFRNCDFIQLRNCVLSNFRVGVWLDWGQDLECFDTTFSLCVRGVQLGGNLTQSETPAPPTGIRGGPGTPFVDNAAFYFCKFSQNQVDINHMGSQQSHGNTLVLNCTFFESSTSPVASKSRFIHATRLKGLNVQNCWFECGNASRDGVRLAAVDYDGNAGAPCYGALICNNHFLLTSATGANGVNVVRGTQTSIFNNVFEIATSGTTAGVTLADATGASFVGPNSWLSYPDIEIGVPSTGIVITGVPPGGHNIWRPGTLLNSPTYGAAVAINAAAGEWHQVTVTNGTAFTIGAPQNARAGDLVVEVFNNSGGVAGALTWAGGGGGFILTGGAWTQPANGGRRNIRFQYSQPKNAWVELARSAVDY